MGATTNEGCVICRAPVKAPDNQCPEYVVCETHDAEGAYNRETYACPMCGKPLPQCSCTEAWMATYSRSTRRA
jgi:hypothetical protein